MFTIVAAGESSSVFDIQVVREVRQSLDFLTRAFRYLHPSHVHVTTPRPHLLAVAAKSCISFFEHALFFDGTSPILLFQPNNSTTADSSQAGHSVSRHRSPRYEQRTLVHSDAYPLCNRWIMKT